MQRIPRCAKPARPPDLAAEEETQMNQAKKWDGRYVSKADILAAGGEWCMEGICYVFPDGSIGRFTDIRENGLELDRRGNQILHFVGGDMAPQ